jgi:hypothetical protein
VFLRLIQYIYYIHSFCSEDATIQIIFLENAGFSEVMPLILVQILLLFYQYRSLHMYEKLNG